MKTLTNNTTYKRLVTPPFILWNNAFSNRELYDLDRLLSLENLEYGKVIGKDEPSDYRKTKIKFIERNDSNYWIFDRFNSVIEKINECYFNFDLTGYDKIQYTLYDSKENGHYDWHLDLILGDHGLGFGQPRKLSLVMLLNQPNIDFEGGEFQINISGEHSNNTIDLQKGTIISFPSFMFHRVAPVTKGIRKSLVIWVEGPKFI